MQRKTSTCRNSFQRSVNSPTKKSRQGRNLEGSGGKSFATCQQSLDQNSESNLSAKSKKNFHSTVIVGSPYNELQINVDPQQDDFKQSSTSRISNQKPENHDQSINHRKSVGQFFEFYKTPRGNSVDDKDIVIESINNASRKQLLSQDE